MTAPKRVLVTGGTGVLGRELVTRLRGRVVVRVLSRRPPQGPEFVRGDLETGAGVAAARCGSDPAAAGCAGRCAPASGLHLDRRGGPVPFGYFRAKLAAERLIAESGLLWTVFRATQFHDLVLTFLERLSKGPIAVVPRRSSFQPVDVAEVAERMAELVMGPPADCQASRARQVGPGLRRRRPPADRRWPRSDHVRGISAVTVACGLGR